MTALNIALIPIKYLFLVPVYKLLDILEKLFLHLFLIFTLFKKMIYRN